MFDRSIRGLIKLNALGYGKLGSGLKLDLVYNPVGGFLPPEQVKAISSPSSTSRAERLVQGSLGIPPTSRRFALGASTVCLIGENPTCSVPALQGCEGLWSYDYGHA